MAAQVWLEERGVFEPLYPLVYDAVLDHVALTLPPRLPSLLPYLHRLILPVLHALRSSPVLDSLSRTRPHALAQMHSRTRRL